MLKEALEYLVKLGNTELFYEHGQVFSTQKLYPVERPTAEPIIVRSLSGFVDYLKSGFDRINYVNDVDFEALPPRLMVHVKSPVEVIAFDALNEDMNRNYLIQAKALLPDIDFDRWYDPENFIIKLQSCFVKTPDRDIMLKVVGNIKEENVNSFGDDGVSQSVVAKTGVATVAEVVVPNPVRLKPYRTFVEIDQPESEFIFRMQNGPRCALFEADGGAWKLEAMRNIRDYLEERLEQEIIGKKITIIA